MFNNGYEKRKEMRYDNISLIDYVVPGQEDDLRTAVTRNVSEGGLNVCLFEPLPIGQELIIKRMLPVGSSSATICWIKKEAERFYKAGMKFRATFSAAGHEKESVVSADNEAKMSIGVTCQLLSAYNVMVTS
ncbi:MAG TPA: PilZ domain-containing protein [Nitrospirota bacterium]|nr:PilZ domain-containing protein [Nitrospirota bacterium]